MPTVLCAGRSGSIPGGLHEGSPTYMATWIRPSRNVRLTDEGRHLEERPWHRSCRVFQLLSELRELGQLNRKQVAALAG
ncbi:MAG: hypothetical protein HOF43_13240, partial [Chloroflexi bacterium]|nr:hypothetical protein [Chloroflexota bacterium]